MDFSKIKFNGEKSRLLESTRGVSFGDVVECLRGGGLIADIRHPNIKRPNQQILVVNIREYAYAVPYVLNEKKNEIFLKTIFPSREFTKIYLRGGNNE